MATTRQAREYGRDRQGLWRPGHMTHAELAGELASATGPRREELVREARTRMKHAGYPSFPKHLLRLGSSDEPGDREDAQPRDAERADAGVELDSCNP